MSVNINIPDIRCHRTPPKTLAWKGSKTAGARAWRHRGHSQLHAQDSNSSSRGFALAFSLLHGCSHRYPCCFGLRRVVASRRAETQTAARGHGWPRGRRWGSTQTPSAACLDRDDEDHAATRGDE